VLPSSPRNPGCEARRAWRISGGERAFRADYAGGGVSGPIGAMTACHVPLRWVWQPASILASFTHRYHQSRTTPCQPAPSCDTSKVAPLSGNALLRIASSVCRVSV
jgi:hypothetical protein